MSSTMTAPNPHDVDAPFPYGLQVVTGTARSIFANSQVVRAARAGQHVMKVTTPNRYGPDREFGAWFGHLPREVSDKITTAEVDDVPALGQIVTLVAFHQPDVLLVDDALGMNGFGDATLSDAWCHIERDLARGLYGLSRRIPTIVTLRPHTDDETLTAGSMAFACEANSMLTVQWTDRGTRLRVRPVKHRYADVGELSLPTVDNGRGRPLIAD